MRNMYSNILSRPVVLKLCEHAFWFVYIAQAIRGHNKIHQNTLNVAVKYMQSWGYEKLVKVMTAVHVRKYLAWMSTIPSNYIQVNVPFLHALQKELWHLLNCMFQKTKLHILILHNFNSNWLQKRYIYFTKNYKLKLAT